MTLEQFQAILPELTRETPLKAAAYWPYFVQACADASVTTLVREACFIAQAAHESAEFRIWRELWGPTADQKNYERPILADGLPAPKVVAGTGVKIPVWQQLGNTEPGDGYKYRGRGPLQTTGRDEYRACGKVLGLDLLQDPDILCGPILKPARPAGPGFQAYAWYWRTRNCNSYADSGDFVGLTKRINGGTNGLAERQAYWATAKRVLGLEA